MERTVKIKNISVGDRIRKEFGNIEELAQDIRENGLINPPVVLPADEDGMYTLLAGERRLRAMKSLGWTETEVRIMEARDAEQELKIEINENKLRKGFSYDEVYESGIKLERVVAAKAKERMSYGGNSSEVGRQNVANPLRTDEEVATELGISREQWRRIKTIIENKEFLDPDEVALWDEGKLSVNKAFQSVKTRLKELEAENEDLKSRKPEIVEVEVAVTPPDYDEAKAEAARAKRDVADYKRLYDDMAEKWKAASAEARKLKEKMEAPDVKEKEHIRQSALSFNAGIANFLEQYGGYVWLMNYIDQIPQYERDGFMRGIDALEAWVGQMKINFNPNGLEFE